MSTWRLRGRRSSATGSPSPPKRPCPPPRNGDGAFGTTVDTGWWGTQGYDAAEAIEELRDHVLHVHLKDVRAVGEPHDTCPWGEGVVDVEACVRALQQIGYEGALVI